MVGAALRLALDQNFPLPLLETIAEWLPDEVELVHIRALDPRLSTVTDRELLIALHQMNLDGLVTNNWKMLKVPSEIAAIIATKAVVIAVKGLGHDAIRATGALLMQLPHLPERLRPNVSNVFLLERMATPHDAWIELKSIAQHEGTTPEDLLAAVRVTPAELSTPVLDA